ncbi:HD domain-containing protein [Paraconexibacter sp. AEG42_29]|uniref:3'-5' exoribonuclease YhaM family protein n=1 Tax=Paraconexibacter sp. AEG42_29 TaxID=2997339 RepID=UPI00339DA227
MPVRDFTDGLDLDQILLVRSVEVQPKRDGGECLRLVLADRTGSVAATIWDGAQDVAQMLQPGRPVRVIGRYAVHPRHGAQLTVRALRPAAPGTYDPEALCDGPAVPVAQLVAQLRTLIAGLRSPHLRALLNRTIGETAPLWPRYRDAPAAKHYHHAYRHGLLEHSLAVAQGVSAICGTFPGVDRDLAVTGGLLHDIGKLEAYTADPFAIAMTDAGRLIGEIPLGYYRVRREIEAVADFPPALAQALLHIVLSHHGKLEHGSPVIPATREATLVHFLDNLGGRFGAYDRLEKALPAGADWSGFDRVIGGGAYFGAGTGTPAGPPEVQPPEVAPVPMPAADLLPTPAPVPAPDSPTVPVPVHVHAL